mmetsp:Transcript_3864/g.13744  ORF Transcript_3864/g.13744 Transcript_3864/m.13744 type:complete len:232 (-) Transcript_3864:669-1364(-)
MPSSFVCLSICSSPCVPCCTPNCKSQLRNQDTVRSFSSQRQFPPSHGTTLIQTHRVLSRTFVAHAARTAWRHLGPSRRRTTRRLVCALDVQMEVLQDGNKLGRFRANRARDSIHRRRMGANRNHRIVVLAQSKGMLQVRHAQGRTRVFELCPQHHQWEHGRIDLDGNVQGSGECMKLHLTAPARCALYFHAVRCEDVLRSPALALCCFHFCQDKGHEFLAMFTHVICCLLA